jgi:hypothetical protein
LIDSVEALQKRAEALDKKITEAKANLSKTSRRADRFYTAPRQPDPVNAEAEVRKAVELESTARNAVEIRGLESRLAILNERLHRLWEGDHGGFGRGNAAERERGILAEIEKAEITLETLRGAADTVGDPGRSAFTQRGGQSFSVRADRVPLGGDSAFAPKGNAAEQKLRKSREAAVDLGSLKI